MNLKTKNFRLIILIFLFTISCNDDNESEQQTEEETFLCCGENPFENMNVDNLDQSAGEIEVFPVFTPNGDAFNDVFGIQNIDLYPNNTVSLFDLNDNEIFNTDNYGNSNFYGGNLNIEDGTLKYKIVIENEQTFVEFGYVCVVTWMGEGDSEFSFYNECSLSFPDFIDPLIPN